MDQTKIKPVELLILGAGWTSTFLIPLCKSRSISYAATTTTGRDGTIAFKFDPNSSDSTPFKNLPIAKTILITFPLLGLGPSKTLLTAYQSTHPSAPTPNIIQLGSTGIFTIPDQPQWLTRHSAYNHESPRGIAEDELRSLGGCVLNLSGLWGGKRQPRDWVRRVAKDKEALGGKASLHVIHGIDVARAVLAVAGDFTPGERWMVTDLVVYDWWELVLGWASVAKGEVDGDAEEEVKPNEEAGWVRELMVEKEVRALPRSMELLGRCYDTREFWERFGLTPLKARAV